MKDKNTEKTEQNAGLPQKTPKAPETVRCYVMSRSSAGRWLERNRQGSERIDLPERRKTAASADPGIRRKGRILLAVLAVIAALAVLIPVAGLTAKQFVIGPVRVEGETGYTAEELLSAAGLEIGGGILGAGSRENEKKVLERLPRLSSCRISVELPRTLVISVSEYRPEAFFEKSGEYYLISSELQIIERSAAKDAFEEAGIPEILMPKTELCVVGKAAVFSDPGSGAEISELFGLLRSEGMYGDVVSVDLSDRYCGEIRLRSGGSIYLGGPGDLKLKLQTAKSVIGENGDGFISVDVSNPGSAYLRKER